MADFAVFLGKSHSYFNRLILSALSYQSRKSLGQWKQDFKIKEIVWGGI